MRPGEWRVLGPALLAWLGCAVALSTPGVGVWLGWGGAALGGLVLGLAVVARARGGRHSEGAATRGDPGARPRGLETGPRMPVWRSLAAPALIASACLLLLGGRITAGETARAEVLAVDHAAQLHVQLTSFVGTGASGQRWAAAEIATRAGAAPLLLWCGEPAAPCGGPAWAPGARFQISGTLVPLAPEASAAAGIRVAAAKPLRPAPSPELRAAALRERLREEAAAIPAAALVPGLAVGDTELMPDTLAGQMRVSGLTHLVAVSGANCALVTGAIGWAAAWLRAGRRTRIVVQAAALAGFVTVVGPEPSVYRAAVMAAVILLSRFGGRRSVALPALGVAILLLLIRDPWQAVHPGFVLSVVATLAILIAAAPVAGQLRRRLRVPAWLALPVSIALVAQLACAPFLVLLQPGLSTVSVLANVLAAPAAPLGTGLGLLALTLLPLCASAGRFVLRVAALPASWLSATAEVTAGLPFAQLPWPEGWPGAALLAACEVVLGLGVWAGVRSAVRQPRRRAPWLVARPPSPCARRGAAALLGLGISALLGPTLLAPAVTRFGVPQDWSVVACDVGQGDAILLRNPGTPREVMLVDTGEDGAALRTCLDRFGVRSIRWLVLSHDHQDHTGALSELGGRVQRALIAPSNRVDGADRALLRELAAERIPATVVQRGDAGGAALPWQVLGPPRDRVPPDANGASVVLRVQAGALSVLLPGDTGHESQREFLEQGTRQPVRGASCDGLIAGAARVDVLKVAHHGSRDQHPCMAAAVGARVALVSAGVGNRYGHPANDTLAQLAAAGTAVSRTDTHGTLALSGTPGRIRVWAEFPDGKSERR
ncbi:ComEC/Rec2 family competence protein [Leucobacter chromiireducens]|uniref:ComEC/Rec2 family competence protein n=1 Tax=Leucobacter chromiireducens TaxID=283877 RepID=UPI001F155855|nr:ComEC/Rec2 family competence protein [Leucobacter chromiireducens]